MAKVTFREERCKGCGLCVEVCPKKIVELNKHQLNSKGYHPAGVTDRTVHRMRVLRHDLSGLCNQGGKISTYMLKKGGTDLWVKSC